MTTPPVSYILPHLPAMSDGMLVRLIVEAEEAGLEGKGLPNYDEYIAALRYERVERTPHRSNCSSLMFGRYPECSCGKADALAELG